MKKEILAFILVVLSTAITVAAIFFFESTRHSENPIILLARAPEKGNWSPDVIKVKKGKEVELEIRNVDVTTHGFYIPAIDLMVREIHPGEVKRVKFRIDKEGEYTFYCGVWCSDYHMKMKGKIVVR
jgi:heme/copper-type cytochrome/quinol oxidase subunit 2